jgi:multidrug efflux pump subunit AcrB
VVADDGSKATTEVYGLTTNLLTSIAIVAVVLMLFLSTQAALIVLISIPTTLLIVLSLGWLFDETINRITLFALILSLGLLVDSAIVVVENIYAHVKRWHQNGAVGSKTRVVTQAVNEIGVGLLLSAVTSIIVFLPMGYITGMMGPYMGPIAFFVPAALLVSFLVAIVITPFLASYVITGENKRLRISVWFTALLERITVRYTELLRRILSSRRKQRWLLRGALATFLLTLLLPIMGLVHFQMLPKADHDQIYVYIDAPTANNIEQTRQLTMEVVALLRTNPYITNTQSFIAEPPVIDFNGMFKGASGRDENHQATIRVNFVPSTERKYSSTELTTMIRERIQHELPTKASFVRFMEEPPGPPVQATMVARVTAVNQSVRDSIATRLYTALPTVSGIEDIFIERDDPVSRTVYTLDKTAAANFGVKASTVANTLALLSDPLPVGEYRSGNPELTPMVITLPSTARDTPSDTASLMVSGADGTSVSLGSVLTATTTVRPSAVHFEGVTPITTVTAEATNRPIVYVMIDVMRMLARGEVEGLSMESWSLFAMTVRDEITDTVAVIEWGGEWEMTLENFRDLGIAMGVALLLVYGVLVAQYKRFAIPAYILVTVPLGLVGILWGFLFLELTTGTFLTATALIGFIALIGLVVNNAIIYLEYVSGELEAGRSFSEALINAGQARLRPIVLTSLTTVLGSLTIATDPVWSGLAWAIIFGLSFSTILTLIIYPTLLMYYTEHQHTNHS